MSNPIQKATIANTFTWASGTPLPTLALASAPALGNTIIVASFVHLPFGVQPSSMHWFVSNGENVSNSYLGNSPYYTLLASLAQPTADGGHNLLLVWAAPVRHSFGTPDAYNVFIGAYGNSDAPIYLAACALECADLYVAASVSAQPDVSPVNTQQTGGGSILTVAAATPSLNDDFVVALFSADGSTSWTTPTGFTVGVNGQNGASVSGEVSYQQLASSSPIGASWTNIGGGDVAAAGSIQLTGSGGSASLSGSLAASITGAISGGLYTFTGSIATSTWTPDFQPADSISGSSSGFAPDWTGALTLTDSTSGNEISEVAVANAVVGDGYSADLTGTYKGVDIKGTMSVTPSGGGGGGGGGGGFTGAEQGLLVLFKGYVPTLTETMLPALKRRLVLPARIEGVLSANALLGRRKPRVLPLRLSLKSFYANPGLRTPRVLPLQLTFSGNTVLQCLPALRSRRGAPAKLLETSRALQIKRGLTSRLGNKVALLEGEQYMGGVDASIPAGSTTVVMVAARDGTTKIVGGGVQIVTAAPTWAPPNLGDNAIVLWDVSSNVFYVGCNGTWVAH